MDATATLSDEHRLVPLRDAACAVGCSERTMKKRLREHGVPVIAASPRRIGVRLSDFSRFLAECSS